MKKLKNLEYKILFELIRNSKISDRKLAKVLGVSQPTITRTRKRLENENILTFTAIPNFEKLGFELMTFIFGHWKHELIVNQDAARITAFLSKHPNVIFMSTGRGMERADRIAISLHKNYSDYVKLMHEFERDWGKYLDSIDSFTVSLKGDSIFRPLTFRYLAEYIVKNWG